MRWIMTPTERRIMAFFGPRTPPGGYINRVEEYSATLLESQTRITRHQVILMATAGAILWYGVRRTVNGTASRALPGTIPRNGGVPRAIYRYNGITTATVAPIWRSCERRAVS